MRSDIWENLIALNSHEAPTFEVLGPAAQYRASDSHGTNWAAENLNIEGALARDQFPLPTTADREGYYGPHHFSFWASGLRDKRNLMDCAQRLDVTVNDYLDFGCASGRVIRHFACQHDDIQVFGSDINRRHVDWVMQYLPPTIVAYQNHSIPSLPMPDNSLDLVSAFSVFTHIKAFETAWLMELRRVLRPGGIAWVTIHSEKTWEEMDKGWPLQKALENHKDFQAIASKTKMPGDRLVFRWHNDRSYSSNVFYSFDYIKSAWGRIFEIAEIHRRLPAFQDVVVLRKSK